MRYVIGFAAAFAFCILTSKIYESWCKRHAKKDDYEDKGITGFAIGVVILAILSIIFPFSSHDNDTAPFETAVVETTSRGTVINDDISPDDVDMIETPDSDCFSAIGYKSGMLVVTFRSSGASYVYWDVPERTWRELKKSDSPGGYYNKEIKGVYACEKLK